MTAQVLPERHPILQGFIFVNHLYERALYVVGAALMGTMVIVVGMQIFARYVLGDSLSWTDELARFLMVWITFLFAGTSFRRGEMIAVEMFSKKLPKLVRVLLMIAGALVSILLFGLLGWFGYSYAEWNMIQVSSALQLPLYYVYLAVPVGCGLMVPHVLVGTFIAINKLLAGEN